MKMSRIEFNVQKWRSLADVPTLDPDDTLKAALFLHADELEAATVEEELQQSVLDNLPLKIFDMETVSVPADMAALLTRHFNTSDVDFEILDIIDFEESEIMAMMGVKRKKGSDDSSDDTPAPRRSVRDEGSDSDKSGGLGSIGGERFSSRRKEDSDG